jgi:hypothetical protein
MEKDIYSSTAAMSLASGGEIRWALFVERPQISPLLQNRDIAAVGLARDELWLEVRDSMVSTQEHTVPRHPGYGKSLPTDEVYRFAHTTQATRIPEEPDDVLYNTELPSDKTFGSIDF